MIRCPTNKIINMRSLWMHYVKSLGNCVDNESSNQMKEFIEETISDFKKQPCVCVEKSLNHEDQNGNPPN